MQPIERPLHHLSLAQRWIQFISGGILGILLGGAGVFPSVVFYVGILVCSLTWLLWQRATKTTRWFGFGLLLGFIVSLVFYIILLVWLMD